MSPAGTLAGQVWPTAPTVTIAVDPGYPYLAPGWVSCSSLSRYVAVAPGQSGETLLSGPYTVGCVE